MEGLGVLGFWIGLGIFLAGGAVAGALKEQAREREKQATVRALLEKGATPEVLQYLREKDAAEQYLIREMWGLNWGARQYAGLAAIIVGFLAFFIGVVSTAITYKETESWAVAARFLIGSWVGGAVVAALIVFLTRRLTRDRKNGQPPAA